MQFTSLLHEFECANYQDEPEFQILATTYRGLPLRIFRRAGILGSYLRIGRETYSQELHDSHPKPITTILESMRHQVDYHCEQVNA